MTLEITDLPTLRLQVAQWKQQGAQVALVPTMGALHAGHVALVDAAKQQADRVVVSIFVNPAQFGPNEDFDKYPRTLADDMAKLREAGADAAWLPHTGIMYPPGFATAVHVAGVSAGLCGAQRPGHFDGVALVVSKLFQQVTPHVALFGEKDYQQLAVIRQLVRDLDMDIAITGVPTLREADGRAMSSRNRYLSEHERAVAPQLYAGLQQAAHALRAGVPVAECLATAQQQWLAAGFAHVEYLELRDAQTLAPLAAYAANARLLVAARLGSTRLIDNIAVE